MIDRLGFVLPRFTRVCWVSDAARDTWETRLEQIKSAWAEIEWRAVAEHVRDCCLIRLSPSHASTAVAQAHRYGLTLAPLPPVFGLKKPGATDIVVGSSAAIESFSRAREAKDHAAIGELLGYPACCRRFYTRVKIEGGYLDTTWEMALRSNDAGESRQVHIRASCETNTFWIALGIRAVPHLPCSFQCAASVDFGARLLTAGARIGYQAEVAWIREILSWPVEWSALHGIAELKTPILRLATRTDATAGKYTLAWEGEGRAEAGARGVSFPHFVPLRALVTDSPSYRRGLEHAPERN